MRRGIRPRRFRSLYPRSVRRVGTVDVWTRWTLSPESDGVEVSQLFVVVVCSPVCSLSVSLCAYRDVHVSTIPGDVEVRSVTVAAEVPEPDHFVGVSLVSVSRAKSVLQLWERGRLRGLERISHEVPTDSVSVLLGGVSRLTPGT